MANVTIGLNSKFDPKGTKDAETSLKKVGEVAADLGKKVGEIGKKMASLAFTKTLGVAGGVINKLISEFDVFKKSVDAIKKSLNDMITATLEKKVQDITANIVAGMRVIQDMVQSVGSGVSKIGDMEAWKEVFSNLTLLSYDFGNVLAKLLETVFSNAPKFLIKGVLKVIPVIKGIIDNIGIMLDAATRDMQINTLAEEYVQRNYRPGGKSQDELRQEGKILATETVDNRIKAALEKAGVVIPEDGDIVPKDLQSALDKLGAGLKNTFFSFADVFTGGGSADNFEKYKNEFFRTLDGGGSDDGGSGGSGGSEKEKYSASPLANALNTVLKTSTEGFKEAGSNINSILANVSTKGGNALKGMMSNFVLEVERSKAHAEKYIELMGKATDPKEAGKYYAKIQDELSKIDVLTRAIDNHIKDANAEAAKQSIVESTNSATEIDEVVNGFMEGGPLKAVAALINPIVSMFSSIENLGKVLNPFTTIIERVGAVLEPLINKLFAPFVIILESIGDIIGNVLAPVFEILIELLHPFLNLIITIFNVISPFITIFSKLLSLIVMINPVFMVLNMLFEAIASIFVWLYNTILMPIGNGLIFIFNKIQEGFVWLYNTISSVIKAMTFGFVNLGSKSANPMAYLEKIQSASATNDYTQPEESSFSGSSSSTAAKDVIVNIFFNNSFVNGDAREIALMLEQELEAAHALGY